MFEMSDSVAGKTIAAPRPMKQRARINCPGVVVSPPARLARPKTASPDSSMPLRPIRSERLPATSSSAANTRLYASTTHCSWLLDACSSRTSVGSATFTIVVSRLIAKDASSSATRLTTRPPPARVATRVDISGRRAAQTERAALGAIRGRVGQRAHQTYEQLAASGQHVARLRALGLGHIGDLLGDPLG